MATSQFAPPNSCWKPVGNFRGLRNHGPRTNPPIRTFPGNSTGPKNNPWITEIHGLYEKPGNDLLSHTLAAAVSSALEGLTSVFGMGTGVAPPA